MPITVKEALGLDILDGFEVIAGEGGLSKEITHVAVWDYEIGDLIEKNFSRGDFALSTLVAIKDDINGLYDIVKRMIGVGITCLAIKNIYFDYIPKNVIKLANDNDFPLMTFQETYTEDVIVYVNRAILEKKEYENLALIVDNILYDNLNDSRIEQIAHKINVDFKEKNIVAFCKKKNSKVWEMKSFSNEEIEKSFGKIFPYEGGYLFINTFEKVDPNEIEKIILRRLNWSGFTDKEYVIGIGSLYESLGKLNYSIEESLYAYKYSVTYKKDISFFKDTGINRIILPIMHNPWVMRYYKEMIEPLIVYDEENKTELLDTAVKYVENNGDIKATSDQMFLHGNTVRYRIDRINKIMNENSRVIHFYEELAIAVRIYNLIGGRL